MLGTMAAVRIGSAYVRDGEGTNDNSLFTELSDVGVRVPTQQVANAVTRNQNDAATAALVTRHSSVVSVFLEDGEGRR